ncbi:MAG: CehA/McbA family metallohydrolase [Clostridia bacterium]|nr:CehA/McbA family metallohydrolase [Clostridia bacterium]
MIIRQAAFVGDVPFLKGNLHTHTTRSDGLSSPETVMRQYAHMGYDFLALTDHRRYNFTNYAPDTGLLLLPGMELDANLPGPGNHVVHMVSLGSDRKESNGFSHDQTFGSFFVDTAEAALPMFASIVEAHNLPIFCHPEWSGNTIDDIRAFPDISLMELWNSGCAVENGLDMHGAYWDELLNSGRRIYGVATDDGHQLAHNGLGFVRVRAEKNADSILDALRRGAFYASCGPTIQDFYVEDGQAVIVCSPVSLIRFRHFRVPYMQATGSSLKGHQVSVSPGTSYIRAEIIDSEGRMAWTNPIFLGEEMSKERP